MWHLFILNLECGQTGLQLLTPLQQLALQWLPCTHHSHLQTQTDYKHRCLKTHPPPPCLSQTRARALYHVAHVGLEVEASWGAEDIVVGLHQFLFVPIGLQTLCSSLQCLQARAFGRLHVLFCRQVGPQGAMQAGMVAQVTALAHTHKDIWIHGLKGKHCWYGMKFDTALSHWVVWFLRDRTRGNSIQVASDNQG